MTEPSDTRMSGLTISVVTPSFNSVHTIGRTIASVEAQDYPALEHIIMDGGSADGTIGVLQLHRHLRWVSEPDRGQAHTVNKAVALAQGDIVGWLNSDDTYCPGALGQVAGYLSAHPECDVVVGRCNIIDENDRVLGRLTAARYGIAEDLLEHRLPQPSGFMRRKAFMEVGGLDESLAYVMDRDLFLRLGLAGRIDTIDAPWANFRVCEGTKTTSHPERFWLETLGVFERFFSRGDLPAAARAVERQVTARALWNAGVLLLAGTDPLEQAQGAMYCRQALDTYDLTEHDLRFLQEMTTHWAAVRRRDDPMSVVQAVLDVTRSERTRDERLRRALTSHAAINLYMGTLKAGESAASRQRLMYLAAALCAEPKWAANRGVWSRLIKHLLSLPVAAPGIGVGLG